MLKLIKYLRPFALTVMTIIIFLFVQAMCDLALPDYMSNIVNIGIQQGGIEDAVPEAIRKAEMDKLTVFMNESDKQIVLNRYIVLNKNTLTQSEYNKYVREYPKLADEPIMVLNTDQKTELVQLGRIMGRPMVIVAEMVRNGYTHINLGQLTGSQLAEIHKIADERFKVMPDSMITQASAIVIQREYGIIGLKPDLIQRNYILYTGGLMLLIALFSMAATVIVSFLGARVAAGLAQNLRRNVFQKVINFSNTEFDHFSTASLITRSTNDIQQIQMLMVLLLRIVVYAPILGIGGFIKVLRNDYSMAWIIGLAVVVIFILVITMFVIAIPKFKKIQKQIDRLNLVTREILSGILVIRAFNTQKHQEKKFDEANADLTRTNLFVNRIMAFMMPAMMLIMNGVALLIVWVGAHQVNQGAMQVGHMMAFIQYAMQIIMAFLMISMVSIMLPRATVSAARIGEVLEAEFSVSDPPVAQPLTIDNKGVIEFQRVSFRYPGAEENALNDISFTALPGQTTAIIGSTGSGKTTLLNLILRFYDVTSGMILFDGVDIRTAAQHELRDKIGYVPQKAVLFSGTIEKNLKYGVNTATEAELREASRVAQVINFIDDHPDGLSANIAQGGANVSGGQKQRLSIARALVKKPLIYLFDDSFSALDFKTEKALRQALQQQTANNTMLVVAQRISTIMHSDQILVLDEGKIVGKGTHRELMQDCEVYRQIALSQLSKEELA